MTKEQIRVLYVDDELNLLDLCKTYLERSGNFVVTTAPGAPEAIRILELKRFDAIVSDYQMPDMDGIEFLKVVRARGDKTPFIIFTGKGREAVVIDALNAGADFYLQKGGEPKAQFAELAYKIKKAVEGRRAEAALRKERDFANSVVGTAQAIVLILDTAGHIVYINPYMEGISGYILEEVKGKDWFETFLPSHIQESVRSLFRKAIGDIKTRGNVDAIITKNGRELLIEWYDTTLKGADGSIEGLLAIGQDVTDKKKVEEALQESEKQYHSILDSMQDAYVRADAKGHIIMVSTSATHLFRYDSVNELIGLPAASLYRYPEERQEIIRIVKEQGEVHDFICEGVRKDGTSFWVSINVQFTFDSNGKVTGTDGFIRDITNRKRIEEVLHVSEARYRTVVEDQTEFICRFTPDGRLTFVNDAYCRYFSLAKDQCLTHPHTVVLPPEDVRQMKQHLASLTPQNPVATIEHRIIMPSGEVRWQRWNDRAIFDKKGQVIEYQSVGRDITEIKNTEKTLRESEAYYRAIFENTGTASVIVEEDTMISLANAEFANLCGYSREEIEGKRHWTEFVVKEDLERMLAQHRLRRKDRKLAERHYEFRFVRKNGEVRNIFLSIDVIPGTKKSIASLLDITGYKKAEQALRESEERYRTLVASVNEAIILQEKTGEILTWNRAAERLFGVTAREVMGHTATSLKWKTIREDGTEFP
ncbi:MAG: PAS domain S-box protein, partial [Methanoregula sp.]|nr:PAS domain S-box protein [Methanoregula sp.]